MKTTIDVKDRKEGDAIRTALADPIIRAQVVIVGTLQELPSDRSRQRVLYFVRDALEEAAGIPKQDGAQ